MLLFNDTDMFTCGTAPKKSYEMPDLELMLYDGFINKNEADIYYTSLLQQTPWREYEMAMYDKIVTAPRMISWYGPGRDRRKNSCLAA